MVRFLAIVVFIGVMIGVGFAHVSQGLRQDKFGARERFMRLAIPPYDVRPSPGNDDVPTIDIGPGNDGGLEGDLDRDGLDRALRARSNE